jgi:thioester reductase-like protein
MAGNKKNIFITGATGLVGGLLALTALRAGHSVRLLARGKQDRSAQDRIRKVLGLFGFSDEEWRQRASDIEICEGDVVPPQFGLSDQEWHQLADHLSCIYHAAAYVGFKEEQREKSTLINIEGVRNVLKLAQRSQSHLFHISTAYIAGGSKNIVFEQELKDPMPWRNPYEETKFLAEREVHRTCQKEHLKYTVYRPAILIGDWTEGRTIKFRNIYYFMKIFHQLSKQGRLPRLLLKGNLDGKLNLLPADFAIQAIWNLSQAPGCDGKIFHITNPSPPGFRGLISMVGKVLGLDIEILNPLDSETEAGGAEDKRMEIPPSLYAPYLLGDPEFDLTNTRSILQDYDASFPLMDENYFRRILTYAIEQDWGARFSSQTWQPREKGPGGFIERYFEEFLRTRLNKRSLKGLKSLNVTFLIQIQDEKASDWVLELRDGMLASISHNPAGVEWRFLTDVDTFKKIAKGLYPPEQAFFDGRVNIEGSVEKALQASATLSEFLKAFPYEEKDVSE